MFRSSVILIIQRPIIEEICNCCAKIILILSFILEPCSLQQSKLNEHKCWRKLTKTAGLSPQYQQQWMLGPMLYLSEGQNASRGKLLNAFSDDWILQSILRSLCQTFKKKDHGDVPIKQRTRHTCGFDCRSRRTFEMTGSWRICWISGSWKSHFLHTCDVQLNSHNFVMHLHSVVNCLFIALPTKHILLNPLQADDATLVGRLQGQSVLEVRHRLRGFFQHDLAQDDCMYISFWMKNNWRLMNDSHSNFPGVPRLERNSVRYPMPCRNRPAQPI